MLYGQAVRHKTLALVTLVQIQLEQLFANNEMKL